MIERSTIALYRDCLRTAHHIGGHSAKGTQLRARARAAFRENMNERDPAKIAKLKGDAMRILSNYLLMKSLKK